MNFFYETVFLSSYMSSRLCTEIWFLRKYSCRILWSCSNHFWKKLTIQNSLLSSLTNLKLPLVNFYNWNIFQQFLFSCVIFVVECMSSRWGLAQFTHLSSELTWLLTRKKIYYIQNKEIIACGWMSPFRVTSLLLFIPFLLTLHYWGFLILKKGKEYFLSQH